MVRLRKPFVASTAIPVMPTSSMNHSRPMMVPLPFSSFKKFRKNFRQSPPNITITPVTHLHTNNTSDASIFRSSCAIQLYVVITRENSPSFRVMIGPRSASRRFCDRSESRSNVGNRLEPRIGRTSDLGQTAMFRRPRGNVRVESDCPPRVPWISFHGCPSGKSASAPMR